MSTTISTLDPDLVSPATLAGLDDAQRRAVLTLDGPLLVVAGPGSGKTRVLTRRLAGLVDAGVWPSRLLAVTFTNKAAAEMRDRVAALIGPEEAARAHVSTFHSLCARLLRFHHEAAGLPRAFTILDADDSLRVVARAAADGGYTTGMERGDVTNFVKTAAAGISRAKNNGTPAEELLASPSPDTRVTGALLAAYDTLLAGMGAVDFDDLLLRVWRLLRTDDQVAATVRSRWSHVSVDEFQDTNAVQYAIVTELVRDHHNLCVVGDADQSIYAFRGAQPSVVNTFTATYPDARVVVLDHNYRSTANICAVSKAVIETNTAAFRSAQRTSNPDGAPVTLTGYNSDLDEARAIVATIVDRGGRFADHGVLVRTNSLTRALEQALTSDAIDYEVVGATRFYERAEIRDAMAWLRVVANPRDQMAFARAISVPKRGVGSVTISKIVADAADRGIPVTAAAAAFAAGPGKVAAAVGDWCALVERVHTAAYTAGPVAALKVILDECGVRKVVADRDAKEHTAREENLDQLLAHAEEFAGHDDGPAAAMEAYLESVALLEAADDAAAGDGQPTDRVQILTVHAAKGKEFPHVYVVGLEEEVLPHARAIDEGEEALAEERRLLFVATSRAQQTLDLSWCTSRMRFGKVQQAMPSRFLDELPKHLMEVVDPEPVRPSQTFTFGAAKPSGGFGGARRSRGPVWRPGAAAAASRPKTKTSPLSGWPAGTRLTHKMFGPGTVTALDLAADTVTVEFDAGMTKVLAASLAPMTKLDA